MKNQMDYDINYELKQAISSKDLLRAKRLIMYGADVNDLDDNLLLILQNLQNKKV